MAATWKQIREGLALSEEEERVIELEKNLIKTLVQIREEKELTQAQLADICEVSQRVIARRETAVHSPQLNSLLKILVPLGYTLEIVPLGSKFSNKRL